MSARRLLAHLGEWNDDDYDVLAGGLVVGRIFKVNTGNRGCGRSPRASRRPHTNARLCRDARGPDVREELAAAMSKSPAGPGMSKRPPP